MKEKRRSAILRRTIFLFAILIGVCYVLVTSSLVGKAISIIAEADSGLLPSLAVVLISTGTLAWIADKLCRIKL